MNNKLEKPSTERHSESGTVLPRSSPVSAELAAAVTRAENAENAARIAEAARLSRERASAPAPSTTYGMD